ncbi:ankyrin repeat and LEM domain-containing protein 1 isoform X2 [Erinaceus europaeus]|uniref:Ankyrin repeat and LEM domain-containing protein 1 isoform X2 n=1 Tax=Erinaceus europaeus TaxID=9365 RepID=A0ABM3WP18_ERIEU|nr:ankyrin repeat and LEM domain-containing protein 1 isoform X2 [Erinaceus europaeus]
MGAEAGLARGLRAALRSEEPRAVEELLRRGADPNLLLPGGAAAVHLAARARHPRLLRCLDALLRGGGDPNARSAEALTPLHVAAAWGCRQGLELLLRHGGDPELRDQDGLRPLDLAEQEGHQHCACLLRGLYTPSCTPTDTLEPQPPPSSDPSKDGDLEAGPGPPSSEFASEEDGGPHTPKGSSDAASSSSSYYSSSSSSSSSTFVTALEASEAEDLGPGRPADTQSPPWARRGLARELGFSVTGGWEAELQAGVQALSLSQPAAAPARCPLREPQAARPEPHYQAEAPSAKAAQRVTQDVGEPSDLELLRGLRALGEDPGPVTPFTRPHFLRRLQEAQAVPGHSPELAEALRTGWVPDAQEDEDAMAREFQQPDPRRPWRGGTAKASFTYLLLDPRETRNLAARAPSLPPAECLQTFVRAIFYVGKGTRTRPYAHLWEALRERGRPGKEACPKLLRIRDIWASGHGVVTLHCFQHVTAVEAYTREACLVEALGLQTLTNRKHGHCYRLTAAWPPARRRRLGVHLLQRALHLLLAEGERQLRPQDLQARG